MKGQFAVAGEDGGGISVFFDKRLGEEQVFLEFVINLSTYSKTTSMPTSFGF